MQLQLDPALEAAAARWRIEAATSDMKSAKAQFYPNVNLTAFLGVQLLGLDNLAHAGSDIGAALKAARAALKLAPASVDVWSDRAAIATGLQQHQEAVDIIDRAIKAIPNSVKLLENRAILLRRAGRSADCEASAAARAWRAAQADVDAGKVTNTASATSGSTTSPIPVRTISSIPATGSAPRSILSSSTATRSTVMRASCGAIATMASRTRSATPSPDGTPSSSTIARKRAAARR